MRILIVGANGTIGSAVARELSARHEVLTSGRSAGDIRLDLADPASHGPALAKAGRLDAVVSTAGNVHFGALAEMTEELWGIGLRDKLMGQVHFALAAAKVLADGGSITLTSGILGDTPIRYGASASLVNGGLEAFARAAAIELPRSLRINVVSPNVLQESMPSYAPFFRGFDAVPAAKVALAYSRSVEGAQTGQVFKVL